MPSGGSRPENMGARPRGEQISPGNWGPRAKSGDGVLGEGQQAQTANAFWAYLQPRKRNCWHYMHHVSLAWLWSWG